MTRFCSLMKSSGISSIMTVISTGTTRFLDSSFLLRKKVVHQRTKNWCACHLKDTPRATRIPDQMIANSCIITGLTWMNSNWIRRARVICDCAAAMVYRLWSRRVSFPGSRPFAARAIWSAHAGWLTRPPPNSSEILAHFLFSFRHCLPTMAGGRLPYSCLRLSCIISGLWCTTKIHGRSTAVQNEKSVSATRRCNGRPSRRVN